MPNSGTDFAVVIAAGGSGSRFGKPGLEQKPKQFLTLKGLPLYVWSVRAFASHHLISRIVICAPSDMVPVISAEIDEYIKRFQIKQDVTVISGGKTRQESVFNGLKELSQGQSVPEYVMVHDAARPFIDSATIDMVARKAIELAACTVGSAVSDTIKRVDGTRIIETLKREELVAVQTPQVARFNLLFGAHQEAIISDYSTTDDVALLEWAGHEVHIVQGPTHNLKLTHPLDLIMAEALADYLFSDLL